jgi:hypothetical protein
MRLKIAAAIAALPFASTANAANIYMACWYQDDMGVYPITQLFTLEGDAIGDSYPTWKYDGIKEWESQFATGADEVRYTSDYTTRNFVGQFKAFAEEWDTHSSCFVTTSKDHALAHFAKFNSGRKVDLSRIQDWRPKNAGVLAVEDWSGRPSSTPVEIAGPEPKVENRNASREEAPKPPTRPKMTNAEADAKYEADMAEYRRKLEAQQKQVDDYKQAQDDIAHKKREQKLAADRAAADYQRQLEAHARTVRDQQLEYRKQVAKPAGVPNPAYRGFVGRDCAEARRNAVSGAGTTSGTHFNEVTSETVNGNCVVQGWSWDTSKGTATRQ